MNGLFASIAIFSAFSILLSVGSLITEYFVYARVELLTPANFNISKEGYIHFGLFKGCRLYNYGFGGRKACFEVWNHITDIETVYVFYICIALIAAASLLAFGSLALAIFNYLTKPKEFICGHPGVLILNCLHFTVTVAVVALFIGLFLKRLRQDILPPEDSEFTARKPYLSYSFWLLVMSTFFPLFNVFALLCTANFRSYCSISSEKTYKPEADKNKALMF